MLIFTHLDHDHIHNFSIKYSPTTVLKLTENNFVGLFQGDKWVVGKRDPGFNLPA